MAKTKPIRDALKAIFYPHVFSLGFELDKRWQPQFVVFRRFSADAVHVFEIQWDKYHRPKFYINFAKAHLEGVMFGDKWMDAKDIAPVHCGTYRRLGRSRGIFTSNWFQLRRPLIEQILTLKRNYNSEEVANQVVQYFGEVENWWENETIGKHVQNF